MNLFFEPGLQNAACRNLPEEHKRWFFPGPNDGSLYKKAKAICRSCPAQVRCLEIAMELHDGPDGCEGIWAGTSARDRKQLARRSA